MKTEVSRLKKDRMGTRILWCFNGIITAAEARQLQSLAGYNECGYGFENYHVVNGQTRWFCWSSCD
jgi:hypothetical protein